VSQEHKWTKLQLDQGIRPTQFDDDHLREMEGSWFEKLSLGKTSQDVIGEYLREVYLYAMQKLQQELGADVERTITPECWVTSTQPLQQLLPGEPAAWKRREYFPTHRESPPSYERHFVKTSEHVLICDAGGGTTDINILNVHPHSEAELAFTESVFAESVWICSVRKRGGVGDRLTFCEHEIKTHLMDRKQFGVHTQTQSRNFPLLSRFGTLLPEPFESQLYHYQRHAQRVYGIFPDVRESKIVKISDPFIGDEGIGPNFGKLNMGREDDDDDNCVGFRRFSGLGNRNNALCHGGGHHGKFCENDIQVSDLHGVIPKFSPPKRDPVAAAIGGHVKRSADETTLAIWRDAIARTCGRNIGFGPTATKKGKEIDWKSAWEIHGNARGEGVLMCPY
jgi:hypothetical protein